MVPEPRHEGRFAEFIRVCAFEIDVPNLVLFIKQVERALLHDWPRVSLFLEACFELEDQHKHNLVKKSSDTDNG